LTSSTISIAVGASTGGTMTKLNKQFTVTLEKSGAKDG